MFCIKPNRPGLFFVFIALVSFILPSMIVADEVEDAIEKGTAYLRSVQNSNGSWDEHQASMSPGITTITTLAFLDCGFGEGDNTVDKAITYILDKQASDGSFATSNTSYQNYVTALAIMVLAAADNLSGQNNYITHIEKAKDFIASKQNSDGGWGYPDHASRSDHSCTQFALMGLHFAYDYLGLAKTEALWTNAIAYLDNTQRSDGGFNYTGSGSSYGSMTAAGLWSYRLCDVDKSDPDVQETMDWISQHYDASWTTNPHNSGKLYYYQWSLAKALQMYGYILFGDKDGNIHEYLKELCLDRLVPIQQENGSWDEAYADNSDHALATAYALMILIMYIGPSFSHSMSFTLTSTDADLHIYGPTGLHVGKDITGHVEIQIEGARVSMQGDQFTIILTKDEEHPNGLLPGNYYIEIAPKSSRSRAAYDLTMRGYRTELETGNEIDLYGPTEWLTHYIPQGRMNCMSVILSWVAGLTIIVPEGPHLNPRMLVAPLTMDLTIVPGESEQRTVTITEITGEADIENVILGASDLLSPDSLTVIDQNNITFSRNIFDVPAGGSIELIVTFNWPTDVVSNSYTGYILVDSDNSGGKQIHISAATDSFSTLIKIDPEKSHAYAGDEFQVDVVVEHIPSFGLQAANVIVKFDPTLMVYVQSLKGDIISDTWQTPLLTDSTVEFNTSTTTLGGETAAGSMAKIYFEAIANAPDDNIPDISFLLVDLRDSQETSIHVSDERKKPGYLIAGHCILGDFNCDGLIDFEDLVIFTFGWIRQDPKVDIGPGKSGTSAPDIIPEPDGVIDIKDLIVFSHMWDWFYTDGPGSPKTRSHPSPDVVSAPNIGTVVQPVLDATTIEPYQEIAVDIVVENVEDLIAAHVVLHFDPENLQVLRVEKGSFLNQNGAYVIFMSPVIGENRGVVDMNTSAVNGSPLGIDGTGCIATVYLRATTEGGALLSIEDCQLRDVNNRAIPFSTKSVAIRIGIDNVDKRLGSVQNYPNPANPETHIEFELKAGGHVILSIFNILGQRVRTLIDDRRSAGIHTVTWDAKDDEGKILPTGIYLYGIEFNGMQDMKKLLLLR